MHTGLNLALFAAGLTLIVTLDHTFGIVPWQAPVPATWGEAFVRASQATLVDSILRYWLVVGIGHAVAYRRLARDRELHASQLESHLARAELQLLTVQLQPHFLFDTLRAIAARVDTDPRGANRMLTRLGDLLRLALEAGEDPELPLTSALAALEPYLKILEARHGLRIHRDVQPAAASACVPNFVLQALVDHAVRRGAAVRAGRSRLDIRARQRNGTLAMVVEDVPDGDADAVRDAEQAPPPEGEGALQDTRRRLFQLYGAGHRLELAATPAGGVRIELEIPYRPAGERPAAPATGGSQPVPRTSGVSARMAPRAASTRGSSAASASRQSSTSFS
jgi:LytS/YehU family sensor histidine kinase